MKLTPEQALEYWRHPPDECNQPESYAENEVTNRRSALVVKLFDLFVKPTMRETFPILEIGCNRGRNLSALADAGYTSLFGFDVSVEAVGLAEEAGLRVWTESFGEMMSLPPLCVFTVACLEHIPDGPVFDVGVRWMSADAETVITIEDEKTDTDRHFPRNYKELFEGVGMKQIFEMDCTHALHGLNTGCFVARVFKKP